MRGRTNLLGRKARTGDAAVGRFVGLSKIGLRLREERRSFGREAKESRGFIVMGKGGCGGQNEPNRLNLCPIHLYSRRHDNRQQ